MLCGYCGVMVGLECCCPLAPMRSDPRVREAAARGDLGTVLRQVRANTTPRLTQKDLATITGLSQGSISRLESGRHLLLSDARKLRRALEGLGLSPSDPAPVVEVPRPSREAAPVAPLGVDQTSWEIGGAMRALSTVLEYGPTRRQVMSLAGAAAVGQVTQWALAEDPPAHATEAQEPGGDALVRRLADSVNHLRMADAQGGASPALRALGQTQLEFLHQLLRNGGHGATQQRQLLRVTAELAGQMGWMAVDAGEDRAPHMLLAALRTAHAADDPILGAGIISYLAVHAYSQGQGREAALMASTALHRLGTQAPPAVRCMLLIRQARGHAVAGQERQARTALEEAFTVFDPQAPAPRWLYWVDTGELHGQAGSALYELGHAEEALGHAERAVVGYRPECVRNQASAQLRAARSLVGMGEVDQACVRAHQALDQVEELNSVRTTGQVGTLLEDLAPYADRPGVVEIGERVVPILGSQEVARVLA